MKGLILFLAFSVYLTAAREITIGDDFGVETAIDKWDSEPLRDDYSDEELEFVRDMISLTMSRKRSRFFNIDLKPKCIIDNLNATCCISLKTTRTEEDICIDIGVNGEHMMAYVGILFNGHVLFERDLAVGKFCYGLPPPLSKLSACLWVYHLKVDIKNKFFDICSMIELARFFHVGLNCIRYDNGTFSIHDDIQPGDKDIKVNLVGGQQKFSIKSAGGQMKQAATDMFLENFAPLKNYFG